MKFRLDFAGLPDWINADPEDLNIESLEFSVVFDELAEFSHTIRSPVPPVKIKEDNMPGKIGQPHDLAVGARKGKVRSLFAYFDMKRRKTDFGCRKVTHEPRCHKTDSDKHIDPVPDF